MSTLDGTFDEPKKKLPDGHPFKAWDIFTPSIATDLTQAYDSALQVRNKADFVISAHGSGDGTSFIGKIY